MCKKQEIKVKKQKMSNLPRTKKLPREWSYKIEKKI